MSVLANSCEPVVGTHHILVVDDDLGMLSVLMGFLTSSNYKVTVASDGASALDVVSSVDLALVISDLRMFPMHGIDLLRKIKARCPDLPVIMLTAFASPESHAEAIEVGAFAYMEKPFLNRELHETIERAIRATVTD